MDVTTLGVAAKPSGELAIDVDQAAQTLGLRIAHDVQCVIDDENADIGDVLANFGRQRVVVVRDGRQKDRPKLARSSAARGLSQ